MFSKTTTTLAVFGLASTLVSAAPAWPRATGDWSQSSSTATPSYKWTSSFPTEVSADGDKFRYPLSNSFPTPSPEQIADINKSAGGTLSNNTPPANISSEGITNLQFVAFNELFEVAFFTSLLQNVTDSVSGFEIPEGFTRDFLIETLTTVQAQEQLHALNANNGLKNIAKVDPISPCEYVFPSTNLDEAILLAQTFTDVTLGTLQDIITVFANADDNGFVRGVAASLGNEGEQNGFYRLLQGKRPSAQPFLTASARSFAFSALNQQFIVPGSCPDVENGRINLSITEPLTLVTEEVKAEDQVLTYRFDLPSGTSWDSYSSKPLKLVLINGQNKPIVSDLDNIVIRDGTITFQAPFNFEQNLLFGLTIASVAEGEEFANVNAVEKAAVFGPVLIEVL